ncbi:hypothetical protein [Streptomyces mirabilis]|uniref:hypothetical protein n=1 Tax=Streptomyces mirabilis TaxID=68239 RepID=UPI003689E515
MNSSERLRSARLETGNRIDHRRIRPGALRNFATVFMPFVLTVTVAVVLPLVSDDSSMNGAADSARLGMEYGANADAVATGLLLVLIPGMIAVHGTVGASLAVRNVVGAEAGVGALETMLGAPYTPASIAAGLLGALALLVSSRLHHDGLSVDGSYVVLSLLLPLLSAWAGAAPALLLSLLFPRLSLPGQGGLAGGACWESPADSVRNRCSARPERRAGRTETESRNTRRRKTEIQRQGSSDGTTEHRDSPLMDSPTFPPGFHPPVHGRRRDRIGGAVGDDGNPRHHGSARNSRVLPLPRTENRPPGYREGRVHGRWFGGPPGGEGSPGRP